jgi:hypothetical protein
MMIFVCITKSYVWWCFFVIVVFFRHCKKCNDVAIHKELKKQNRVLFLNTLNHFWILTLSVVLLSRRYFNKLKALYLFFEKFLIYIKATKEFYFLDCHADFVSSQWQNQLLCYFIYTMMEMREWCKNKSKFQLMRDCCLILVFLL